MSQVHNESTWIDKLARVGYTAKGIVYATVGLLAVQTALGRGGKTTDTKGALGTIAAQPFGQFMLAVVALGLIGYVVWLLGIVAVGLIAYGIHMFAQAQYRRIRV